MLDDAFITFRYARHFADGLGPVWNVGERVEGYSNFLWMLFMSGVHKMGAPPIISSQILGISCFLLNLLVIYQLGIHWFNNRALAAVGMGLCGLCFTMAAFATGGLETALYGLEWSLAILLYIQLKRATLPAWPGFLLLGLLLAFTQLTRPDGIVLMVSVSGALGYHWYQNKHFPLSRFLILLAPFVLIVGGHELWRIGFYGDWLPNTFYIKSGMRLKTGLGYVGLFACLYGFPVIAAGLIPKVKRLLAHRHKFPIDLLLLPLPWIAYLIYVGGDFMEFRMWVPIIPLLYLGAIWLVDQAWSAIWVKVAFFAVLVIAGVLQPYLFRETLPGGNSLTVFSLNRETMEPERGLVAQGKLLGELFRHDASIHLATGTAGAIPYYAQTTCTDLLGLNDAQIAKAGNLSDGLPGHTKFASGEYIQQRGVHLQLSRWTKRYAPEELRETNGFFYISPADLYTHFGVERFQLKNRGPEMMLLRLENGEYLHTLYYHSHPKIEAYRQANPTSFMALMILKEE